MLKTLHVVTSVLTVFIASLFFLPDQNVKVRQSAVEEAVPGQNFVVELAINKGNIDGFAQLQLNLPEGFTAEPMNTGNAKFSVEGRFVRFTWFALPADPYFTVSYSVLVGDVSPGEKKITGVFSYIEKDKTKTVTIAPALIKLNDVRPVGLPAADAEEVQQDKGADELTDAIQIDRHMPDHIAQGDSFEVQLTVRNRSVHGSAKIVEHIPRGWTASKGETSGALFKTQDSLVKFIWLAMPKDVVFKLSYYVVPAKNTDAVQTMYGTFAFEEKGVARSFDYFPSQSANNVLDPLRQVEQSLSEAAREVLVQQKPREVVTAMATSVPSPETGVMYKVQIAACRKDVRDLSYFNSHYRLQENVSAEMHEGWHKYVIGGFNEYRTARDMRVNTNVKVTGAFVVAYNNGQRVTVREALNVTGQKWVQ